MIPFAHHTRRTGLRLADGLVTLPAVRWTWRSLADHSWSGNLPELRPADAEAVRDMMAGRYLLASKLVQTGGTSPFAEPPEHPDWWHNLHSFSWLRHFRDLRDPGQRGFARTLVLDWIGRDGGFARPSWAPAVCAQRVLNWLRHLQLLLDGATPEQARTIQRALGAQIQSLKVREPLATDPVDQLFAAIALLGAAACDAEGSIDPAPRLRRLNLLLAEQLDGDGLHRSRNARLQLQLLVELSSVRRAPLGRKTEASAELAAQIDRMHASLGALTLGTGEPGYFNGCGQLPHDILIAVQSDGPAERRRSTLLGGYGILRAGDAVVVADSGLMPPAGFADQAHHSPLAFEFSSGSALLVANCGPAPADRPDSQAAFRQALAHSGPTIDGEDPEWVRNRRPEAPGAKLDPVNNVLTLSSTGYRRRFGVDIERQLTLLAQGTTLVGQDRLLANGTPRGVLCLRFHLGPGVVVHRTSAESVVRLVLPNGAEWSFLWEGGSLHEDDSVRQSASLGLQRTRQLVLEAPAADGAEIAWIFTRQDQ
ncbi:MAG: hypothetical protein JWR39_1110 [Devosia sp.]|nr:hypothetical protein [Devosia sp.]